MQAAGEGEVVSLQGGREGGREGEKGESACELFVLIFLFDTPPLPSSVPPSLPPSLPEWVAVEKPTLRASSDWQ